MKTKANVNYYEVSNYIGIGTDVEPGSPEWYRAVALAGYRWVYRWVNSDNHWMWLAASEASAVQGAVELYASEKKCDLKTAREYYSGEVDVCPIEDIIRDMQ